jgi:hypothetical protein
MENNQFEEYLIEYDEDWSIDFMMSEIYTQNITDLLDNILNRLDCTKKYPSGIRVMQTIGYPYKREITRFFFVLENVEEDNIKEDYYQKLVDRHNSNLEFEADNPPIWYSKKYKLANERKAKERTSKVTKSRAAKLTKEQKASLTLKEKIKSMGITKLNLTIKAK